MEDMKLKVFVQHGVPLPQLVVCSVDHCSVVFAVVVALVGFVVFLKVMVLFDLQ